MNKLTPCFLIATGVATAIAVAAALAACSPGASPKLQAVTPPGPPPLFKDVGETALSGSEPVDILFVIDDSSSMGKYQASLARNFDQFIDALARKGGVDYHIAVTTTSTSRSDSYECAQSVACNGLIRTPFVDRNTPNGLALMRSQLAVGIGGNTSERMFDPVNLALTPPMLTGPNAGFYRPDAYLAVIFVTDTEDQSVLKGPQQIYNFLVNDLKKGQKRKVMAFAAFIPVGAPTSSACQRDDGPPYRTEEFLRLVGGSSFNICTSDFGARLAGIADDLATRIGQTIYLTRVPDEATLWVHYGNQTIPSDAQAGWTYLPPPENALAFGPNLRLTAQPAGTRITAEFRARGGDQAPAPRR